MKKLLTASIGTGLNLLSHIAPGKTGELGFQLFCYPMRPKMLEKHRAFLLAARSGKLRINGEEIQVYKWGRGPEKILFVHGWQSHTYRWKPYIEQLDPAKYTIYSVDAPAHGLSTGRVLTVPFYGEVIRQLSERTGGWHAMVGHSLGSFTLMYAVREFRSIDPGKLVLLAPPSGAIEFVRFYQDTLNLSNRTVRLTVEHFTNRLNKPPEYYSAKNFARELTLPGLIIHDSEDSETSVENARQIHQYWKGSDLVITTGYGHNLRSEQVVQDVTCYLNKPQHC